MVEETHFLLEQVGMVFEVVLIGDVLLLDSLNVEEVVLAVGQYLSRVVEVYSDHVVAQDVANAVLGGIVNPFLYCYVAALRLDD